MNKSVFPLSLLVLMSSAIAMNESFDSALKERLKITFRCNDVGEYHIQKTSTRPFRDGPVMKIGVESKVFKLVHGSILELDLDPEDVIQISMYACSHPAHMIFHQRSLGKKFRAKSLRGDIILIHKDGFSIQKSDE